MDNTDMWWLMMLEEQKHVEIVIMRFNMELTIELLKVYANSFSHSNVSLHLLTSCYFR